jgi:hypothetical protein
MTTYTGRNVERVQRELWVFDDSYAHLVCALSKDLKTNPKRVIETFEKYGMPRNAKIDRITTDIYRETIQHLERKVRSPYKPIAIIPGGRIDDHVESSDLREKLQSELCVA